MQIRSGINQLTVYIEKNACDYYNRETIKTNKRKKLLLIKVIIKYTYMKEIFVLSLKDIFILTKIMLTN